jgi:hypothetical protein
MSNVVDESHAPPPAAVPSSPDGVRRQLVRDRVLRPLSDDDGPPSADAHAQYLRGVRADIRAGRMLPPSGRPRHGSR